MGCCITALLCILPHLLGILVKVTAMYLTIYSSMMKLLLPHYLGHKMFSTSGLHKYKQLYHTEDHLTVPVLTRSASIFRIHITLEVTCLCSFLYCCLESLRKTSRLFLGSCFKNKGYFFKFYWEMYFRLHVRLYT